MGSVWASEYSVLKEKKIFPIILGKRMVTFSFQVALDDPDYFDQF